MKKTKYCEYSSLGHFITLYFLHNLRTSQINQSVCYWQAFPAQFYVTLQPIGLIHKLRRKQSIENTTPGAIFIILYFLRDLRTSQISQSICSWQAFPAQFYVTLQPIGLICKLQRKQSIVNTAPVAIFIKLYFLRNLQRQR